MLITNLLMLIVFSAIDFCEGSSRNTECQVWYQQCMIEKLDLKTFDEYVHSQYFDNAEEHCAENLPEWASYGM